MSSKQHFLIHKLKKRAQLLFGAIADWSLVLGAILIGGFGSSWYMIEWGSGLTTVKYGPWESWTSEARADADPYTRAHFVRAGTLYLSAEIASVYVARTDSDGVRLHSSCEYAVKGQDHESRWWSVSVFDDEGRLIENPAKRYSFTRDTVSLSPDGQFLISLARDARPGNWLPTGGGGRLQLVMTLLEGRQINISSGSENEVKLPAITTVSCR